MNVFLSKLRQFEFKIVFTFNNYNLTCFNLLQVFEKYKQITFTNYLSLWLESIWKLYYLLYRNMQVNLLNFYFILINRLLFIWFISRFIWTIFTID